MHQIEFMFCCQLEDGERPSLGAAPDEWQTEIAWLPLDDLTRYRLYPAALKEPIALLEGSLQPMLPGGRQLRCQLVTTIKPPSLPTTQNP